MARKARKSAARASFSGERDDYAEQDEKRRDGLSQPWRPELAEHNVKGDPDADCCEGGTQPTGKRSLGGLYCSILGQIGPKFSPLRAFFRITLAIDRIILRHQTEIAPRDRLAIAEGLIAAR